MCGDGEGDCSRDSDCSGSLVRFTFILFLNFHFCTILSFGVVGDLIDLYFELCGTNMLHKKQIIHKIHNEMTASRKRGSSNVNNMFCALES